MSKTFQTRNGETLEFHTDSGDGYWCPTHQDGCFRRCEDRRWGRFGAAGVLFVHKASGRIFLNQRSMAIHHGGLWSVLGGALDRGETAIEGALREAHEEMGMLPESSKVIGSVTDSSAGGWSYTTVIVEVDDIFQPLRRDWESMGFGWFTVNELVGLRLHPSFKNSVHKVLAAMYYEDDLEVTK